MYNIYGEAAGQIGGKIAGFRFNHDNLGLRKEILLNLKDLPNLMSTVRYWPHSGEVNLAVDLYKPKVDSNRQTPILTTFLVHVQLKQVSGAFQRVTSQRSSGLYTLPQPSAAAVGSHVQNAFFFR